MKHEARIGSQATDAFKMNMKNLRSKGKVEAQRGKSISRTGREKGRGS
jgi:hypothetical protein